MAFIAPIGNFIRKVRRSDDRTKRRWLAFFSSVIMILVVFLWIEYLGATLPRTNEVAESTSTVPITAEKTDNGGSFLDTLSLGWSTLAGKVGSGADSMVGLFEDGWSAFQKNIGSANNIEIDKPQETAPTSTPESDIPPLP